MLRIRRKRKGQSAVEFVVVTTIIIGALLAMQMYIKRGVQGRWKAAMDDLGDQYDPLAANSNFRYTLESETNTTVVTMNSENGYYTKRSDYTSSVERKEGYMGSGPYNFFNTEIP